ncbi:MAG: hypothetical protein AAF999_15735 [Pseudomonadota bacterium]
MTDAELQSDTVLPADASALVATADGGLELVFSNGPGDMEVQQNVQVLVAAMLRSEDGKWFCEMMSWLEKRGSGG